jgi:hypothetical protein
MARGLAPKAPRVTQACLLVRCCGGAAHKPGRSEINAPVSPARALGPQRKRLGVTNTIRVPI